MRLIENINLEITHIAHIADVHIRNVKRHDEYVSVFEKLYLKLNELKQVHPKMAIYLGGDIVHTKLDMSPELIRITHSLLKKCADIAPTFLILGNHDCNLNNLSRLDALTPIVETIDNRNLYYLKETGIYRTKEFDFVNWAITDNIKNYTIPKNKNKKILLYHGAVDSAVTEHGMELKNNKVNLDMISEFDFALMGDIHKRQYLNEKKTIAYCGSTVQQNYGEDISHGFLFWTLSTGFSKYYELENDWGYFTIEVKDGKIIGELPKFSKHPRIRIKSTDTSTSDMAKIVASIKSIATVDDIRIQRFTTKAQHSVITTKKVGDIRDVEHQNNLIVQYLEQTYALDDPIKNKIFEINRQLNTSIDVAKSIRNVTWKPMRFEFSNMFSYGKNNEINFENMTGVYGLFAANASGKSSIFDALMFCLFDKCSRTFKAAQVLNNKKNDFYCKFQFRIHGNDYFIERTGEKDKKGHVKVNVNFWKMENGNKVILNGDDREGTNFIIRDYLGNYEEFSLTTLSLQNNNTNFVDKAQRERKDLLSQFLDLNVFEELTQLASTEANQIKAVIKEFNKHDYPTKISESSSNKKIATSTQKQLIENKKIVSEQLADVNNSILQLTKELKSIDSALLELDLVQINNDIADYKEKIEKCENKIAEFNSKKDELVKKYESLMLDNQYIDIEQLEASAQKYQELKEQMVFIKNKLSMISISIENNQKKVDKLSTHEYDPDCEYCVKNEFVADALDAKKTLDDELVIKQKYENELQDINSNMDLYARASYDLNVYNLNKNETVKLNGQINEIDSKINEFSLFKVKAEFGVQELEAKLKLYKENKESIEQNKLIQSKIDQLNEKRELLVNEIDQLADKITNVTAEITLYDSILKNAKTAILELSNMEEQFRGYELYLKATNRNGVPYHLISDSLPKIQNEVNLILEQVADFQLAFDTDGKSINVFIIYDDDRFWPLEMSSGMERFLSSIAIRIALVNFSNLPRPNFMAIDEGFGVLDSENLTSLYNLFQYMKSNFEFIVVISHIESMRDMVDTQLNISKINDFSNVVF